MNIADQYPVQIAWSDEDHGFIATAEDLPGCSAFGETQQKALRESRDAITAWIDAATSAGNPVPEPSRPRVLPQASGKALLRLPKGLHGRLIAQAEEEGSSFNTYCIALLTQNNTLAMVKRSIVQTLGPITDLSAITAAHVPNSLPAIQAASQTRRQRRS